MMKRVIALLLCLLMCCSALIGCAQTRDKNDKGAYITMYLTNEVYNFDPVYAYNNAEAESIASLLFARLFTLSKNGKIQNDLATGYDIEENKKTGEYTMVITLRKAWWSDKIQLTADDVVCAWERILDPDNNFACASLLYDIKNARAVKNGECSINDLGVCSLDDTTLQITFEKPIDYNRFLLNLTSLALAPIRDDYVSKGDDWAKKPGTMAVSGPFKIGKAVYEKTGNAYRDSHELAENGEFRNPARFDGYAYSLLVLERNPYYNRDPEEEYAVDKSVTPYRILIDCSKSDEEIIEAYQSGELFYIGHIPCSLRTDKSVMKKATITDAHSTKSFYLNENALIENTNSGEQVALFAIPEVRAALSLALDRNTIAEELVLAKAATGLVPYGIFNKGTSGSFRKTGGELLDTDANIDAAKQLLSDVGIKPKQYKFSITVNENDEDMMLMATAAMNAWTELGFKVSLNKRGTILNNDFYEPTNSVPEDLCDELYLENLIYQDYEVYALDYCAYTADAFSMLSSFATTFSGGVDSEYNPLPHNTGYASAEYDALIEAVYYLPFYEQITAADYAAFAYTDEQEFQAVLDRVSALYEEYNINTKKSFNNGRATLLHAAEELLMEDMPIIPVVFNRNATIKSGKISSVKSNYYVSYSFTKTSLKNYHDYVEAFEEIYARKQSKK